MSKHKLLLADDSITIQKVVNLTFADEGIEVVAVGDGDTALQKIIESAPDLVMADVNMPGLSGYQICETLKQNPEMKNIPVILLVGSFEPFDEDEARRVGADDFMTKPFQSIRQLVTKVSDLLAKNNQPVSVIPDESSRNNDFPVAGTTDPEEFIDTLSNMKEPSAVELENNDDEMIQADPYHSAAAETTKLNPDYLNEADKFSFNHEPAYSGIHTVSDFETESDDEFSSNGTQIADYRQPETAATGGYNSTGDTHQVSEQSEEYQVPAVYDFAEPVETESTENIAEPEIADETNGLKDLPAQAVEDTEQNPEAAPKPEFVPAAEEIPAPKAASVLEFDDLDLLELPPIEPVITRAEVPAVKSVPEETPEIVEPEMTANPEITAAVENSVSASGLSPEAIEAIAQRVVEKLSERFFDKEL